MKTLQYLSDPMLAGLYWPGIVTGLAIAALCALLSVLVVLKRLAFIGQGISHAAFGGAGIAASLGLAAGAGMTPRLFNIPLSESAGITLTYAVVFLFCLLSALIVARLSERAGDHADTAVGIVLVAAMALGAILLHLARGSGGGGVQWETFLFGSIVGVVWADALIGWAVALLILAVLWLLRRPMLFWAFDPAVARAMGVSERAMSFTLMALLALAIVTAMKLAGVVLATAMLVLPGAAALRLSAKGRPVILLAALAALLGVVMGVIVSFEFDWPTGPSVVAVLVALYALARLVGARKTA